MTITPRGHAITAIAMAVLAALAAGVLLMPRTPPRLSDSVTPRGADDREERAIKTPDIPKTESNPYDSEREVKKSDVAADIARVEIILRDIEGTAGEERLRLWREVDDLRARSPAVRDFLFNFARDETGRAAPYPRFVAAATVAGFGRPTRIGPNRLLAGTSLAWYIDLQRNTPVYGPRRLELDPTLNNFKVEVAPNESNDSTFTGILWTILSRYPLSFTLEPDGTFLISPTPPLT